MIDPPERVRARTYPQQPLPCSAPRELAEFEPETAAWTDLAADADGVVWTGRVGADGPYLAAFDGTAWTAPTWPDDTSDAGAIEATSDGSD